MAPSTKENEVLIAPSEKAGVSVTAGPRHEDTATGSRPQPVALEVPVTVNGARTVEGSDKREPFSETTKTVLVFGNGAVIRLGSPVAAGQLLFLTNEKTKKEVVCQVVKSKNYKSVSGYVELEFTESVVGFWGMRFPSDRIGAPPPPLAPAASLPLAAKSNSVAPVAAVPKPVVPAVIPAPKTPELKPTQVHGEVKPAPQPRPVEASVIQSSASKPQVPSVQNIPVPVAPVAKKPEVPVIPAPAASSLASSLASLLGAPEAPSPVPSSKQPASFRPSENKPQPASIAAENSSEDLKLQAARLQEQLSSMLFSAAPTAKPAPPVPLVPAVDPKAVSGVAAQILEIAKSEPLPVKAALPTKPLPPPIKSSLDTEEVKIPSWLEPLARNAAAPPSTQDLVEREKTKHTAEVAAHEVHPEETLSLTAVESVPESALPTIGSLVPLDEEVITQARSSSGSGKGVLYGAIAAAVLMVAGGAWYLMHPANAVQGTSAPVASVPSSQANATPPAPSVSQSSGQPVSQPVAQNSTSAPVPVSSSNTTPVLKTPASSMPVTKSPVSSQPAPVTRDNTRGSGTTIPAAATERISRPPAEPEPKKPALGEVHLASPTMNRSAAAQDDGAEAPSIAPGNPEAISGGLNSGLPAGNGKQPAAPEVPLPVGGDVKSAKLTSKVDAIYPAMAKNQHISGDVRVDALIDANGRVTTMKVISGPTLLHQAAMDALRQWKYQPATLDGKPVPMHLTVTLQFRLQ
jgi:TonB family protein